MSNSYVPQAFLSGDIKRITMLVNAWRLLEAARKAGVRCWLCIDIDTDYDGVREHHDWQLMVNGREFVDGAEIPGPSWSAVVQETISKPGASAGIGLLEPVAV